MNKKKWIITIAIILTLGAGLLGFNIVQNGNTEDALAASGDTTTVVQRSTLQEVIEVSGNLTASKDVSLMFTANEPVAEILVAEGDNVEAEQRLASLETDSLALEVAQAEADLAQAEIALTDTLNGAREEEIAAAEASVNNARASYSQVAAGSREEEIASAEAELERAAAEVQKEQGIYDRMIDQRGRTMQAINLWEATLDYEKALADYESTVNGATSAAMQASWAQVEEAQASLDELQNGATPEEIELAEIEVEKARIALQEAQNSLEEAILTAPMAGTITAINIVTGEIPSGDTSAMILSDLATLEIEIDVDETDITMIDVGQTANISIDALSDITLAGEVTHIAPDADTSSGMVLYPVTIQLTDIPERFPVRAGMTADVEIITASQEDTLIVPLRAIQSEGGRTYVSCVTGDQVEQVEVELGMMTDTQVEILSGLEEGDTVSVIGSSTDAAESHSGFGPMGRAMQ